MTQATEQRNAMHACKPRTEKVRLRDRDVSFTVSMPKAIFGVFFTLFIVVWVFIFGIFIGRGHNPEEMVPAVAKVMPAPQEQPSAPSVPADTIIPPRDLKYHDSLKGKDTSPPPRAVTSSAVPPEPANSAPQQSRHPRSTPAVPQRSPLPVSKPAPSANPRSQSQQDQTVYNYVYQVAAFTNLAQAQTMQKKLQGSGIAASVNEAQTATATWFRVFVSFKGKPEETKVLREKLAQNGVRDVVLRGKTPAK